VIDKSSPIPAYHQLTLLLRTKIQSGEWAEGNKIPKEEDLAALYRVSRVTVRQALEHLEIEGLINRLKRKGTFVRKIPQPIIHDFSLPSILCTKLGQNGISLDAAVLELKRIPQMPVISSVLRLKGEQPLVYIKRLFLLDSLPIALNESWISDEMVPDIVEKGLINNHLSITLIRRYNLSSVIIQNTIEAVSLKTQEIQALKIKFETPIIAVTSISFLPYEVPLEYSRTLWRGDRVKFSFSIPEQSAVSIYGISCKNLEGELEPQTEIQS
jgi:DNA-binding GntR family transcriptional regulator